MKFADVVFDLIAQVPGDENKFIHLDVLEHLQDMTQYGFARDVDQRFGFSKRVRAQARAETGERDDDLHEIILRIAYFVLRMTDTQYGLRNTFISAAIFYATLLLADTDARRARFDLR